ncbi:GGDEF domain-containing protein [Paraglaciecola aquimarina]|uniref:diguanylate cyclase n=1 Tax=Paraglaciecola algarum TaxID=3050085 RepID=A0ABS9D523_9ALTE|nr:GGDEF domain-containing protein [Paraglaciecola sp. G1-23]MCF2948042.1 GGDEF domain-containing protein [Paraglaciecola sp. G1-23]
MASLSVILLVIPEKLFFTTQSLSPNDYPSGIFGDQASGGSSTVKWLNKDKSHWLCELNDTSANPYCSWQLTVVGKDGKGIDMSNFSTITLYGKSTGVADYFRVYLRNRNPEYYVFNDTSTTKYNVIELPTSSLSEGIKIKLADFKVADWWLSANKIALEHSHPEFNDVIYIELQNATFHREGKQEFQLDRIELEGAIFSQELLYKIIVLTWISCILALLIFRVFTLNKNLKENIAYQQELVSINKLLNLENQKFEDLAKTDMLTGLLNRLGIRDILYEGLTSWKRNKKPFSFVLLDIDHFKSLNDTYGHDVGDKVLKTLAKLLTENVRSSDYLARWGGEEFILVCPNTNLSEAQQLAELLRSKIEQMKLTETGPITASFGVATMATASLDSLFKSSDKALYQAKEQGRNKVVIHR